MGVTPEVTLTTPVKAGVFSYLSPVDILTNPFNTIFAVNCIKKEETLYCGALYLEARQRHEVIRLADKTATIDVRLPTELLDQPQAQRAWDVELPLVPTS